MRNGEWIRVSLRLLQWSETLDFRLQTLDPMMPSMIGVALNVTGILIGGLVGLIRPKPLSPANESRIKVALGAFTVFYGLRLTWLSLNGSFPQMLKQLLIRLGQGAREQITAVKPADARKSSEGFKTCAVLFCAAPLAILGSVQDGLSGYFYPLAVKAVIDGLATMGFVRLFGWGAILAALPVLTFQGTITLACAQFLKPGLDAHGLVDPVNAAGGLLVFCVALIILELKRIELADYLPSLAFAPLLAWVFR